MICKRNDLIYKLLERPGLDELKEYVVRYTAFKQGNTSIAFKFIERFGLKETAFPELMRVRRKVCYNHVFRFIFYFQYSTLSYGLYMKGI
jgi:hypothetical protein